MRAGIGVASVARDGQFCEELSRVVLIHARTRYLVDRKKRVDSPAGHGVGPQEFPRAGRRPRGSPGKKSAAS